MTEAPQHGESLLDSGGEHPFERFLSELEAPVPSPCGGSAAAAAAAMAASLVTMVARETREWADGPGIASQARALRARLMLLYADDVVAFADVIEVIRTRTGTPEQRNFALGEALLHAAEVPLQIAEAAADVAELAALASSEGSPQMRPDATTAAILAEAAVRGATHLVEINLATVAGDHNSIRAERLAAAAAAARARALRSV